jgi:hypothetical protein
MVIPQLFGIQEDPLRDDSTLFQTSSQPVGMGVTGPVSVSSPEQVSMGSSSPSISPIGALRTYKTDRFEFTLHQISTSIDDSYNQLFSSILSGVEPNWSLFRHAAKELLGETQSPQVMDSFFEVAEPISSLLVRQGKLEAACCYWTNILDAVTSAEDVTGNKCHKGSGYYFWSCAHFARGDVDTALLLMHEALVEDKLYRNPARQAWPDTSASMVISLNNDITVHHPASQWINNQVIEIDNALSTANSGITADEIRSRFFMQSDPASVFLFIYAHAALLRIENVNPRHRDNVFVGRLALSYLFHIAVVIENALQHKTGITGFFGDQIKELSSRRGGLLKTLIPGQNRNRQYLSDLNRQSQDNPDMLLRGLLSGTSSFQIDGTCIACQDRPLCIAYVLRNLGGHCLDAPSVVAERLHDLRVQMLAVLAVCIREYYP